ncbi:MAG: LysR family transcriptional regulator, partial [Verrucomicrobia bacterium]|nr:LysR family transcriptional regulator [Verrucomicrobiota bacterium]
MQIESLKVFCDLTETESFTKAAQINGVTQSAVSQQISSLERLFKSIISGTIRVATIYSIGLHDLPPYIKRFLKDYPTVHVHVEYRRANQVYEDVLGNIVDLGLVAYPHKEAKLEIVPLRKDPLVLICHPHHPFAKQKTVRLKNIVGEK